MKFQYPSVMSPQQIGILIAALGGSLLVVGILVWTGALSWFGSLPGDLRIEGENTRVFIPITSMLLVSLVLTLLVHLFRRVF